MDVFSLATFAADASLCLERTQLSLSRSELALQPEPSSLHEGVRNIERGLRLEPQPLTSPSCRLSSHQEVIYELLKLTKPAVSRESDTCRKKRALCSTRYRDTSSSSSSSSSCSSSNSIGGAASPVAHQMVESQA